MKPNTVIHIGTVNLHAPLSGVAASAADLISDNFNGHATKVRGLIVPPDIVFDQATGLMWSKATTAKGKTWSEAKEAAAAVRLGGYSDWRLPTRKELLTLVDDTRSDPSIDTDKFDCDSAWYWSSTPLASSPSVCAWVVGFNLGIAYCNLQSYGGRVRAVRSVSPSASGQ